MPDNIRMQNHLFLKPPTCEPSIIRETLPRGNVADLTGGLTGPASFQLQFQGVISITTRVGEGSQIHGMSGRSFLKRGKER